MYKTLKFSKEDVDKLYFTSDSHYGHHNICRSTTRWTGASYDSTREFNSLEDMNLRLIQAINNTVPPDGILFHNGDIAFGSDQNIPRFIKQLNVKEIHLIVGNHDKNVKYHKNLFKTVNDCVMIEIGKLQSIWLSHYAHRVWPSAHKGVWHLYGHTHDTLENYGKSMDVGVDTNRPTFAPYSFKEIKKVLDKQENIHKIKS